MNTQAPFCESKFLWPHDGPTVHRIPSLALSTKGTVLAFADKRKGSDGDFGHDTDVVLKRSLDGGRTWQPEQTLATETGVCFHSGPALVDRETEHIFKFYRYVPAAIKNHQMLIENYEHWVAEGFGNYYVTSDDDGASWSDPVKLDLSHPDAVARLGLGNGLRGAQLSSGRLVIPCSYWHSTELTKEESARVFLLYSDDHGETWHNGTDGPRDGISIEVAILATADDEIYLNHRTWQPHRIVAWTKGQGTELAEHRVDEALPESICHASLARYSFAADGERDRMLFCNPAVANEQGGLSFKTRRELTVRLSYDEGRTWPVSRLLEPGRAAYSDILTLPDGTILCIYETGPENCHQDIQQARFNLAWLTAAE